ncbi:MAG: Fic family protein [Campylobacterota bacterium]|nr:Fic family protein [Campylobacterota bacterium]
MLTKKQITKINTLREEYFQNSVGKEQLLKLISETEVFEQVYNSNAIENSTLSIEETEKILLQIDLDRYVSEREIYEAKNLARVTEYIDSNAKDKELASEMMLFLHKILISNIRDDIAGRFRMGDEYVRVGNHIASAPSKIAEGLENTFMTYKADASKSIVERIARFHLDFETLHPFIDGNGRIGRSLNNYLLIREEYVPINIRFLDRQEYYKAFQEFNMLGKTEIMEKLIYGALVNSYYKRLAYLKSLKIVTLNTYAKTHKLSHPNLINKAKRHTIPAFMEKGVWMIGDEEE